MMFCGSLKKCELKKCGLCDKPCKRPPCKPQCPCIKKIEEVREDLHTLEGKVDRNTQKIKNNYNLLNDAISNLAEKHTHDHNYVINYIDQKNAENDYLLQQEIARAKAAEQDIDDRLAKEIRDRIEDVNNEEARAKAAETNITNNLNQEIQNRINGDNVLQQNINNLEQKHDQDIQDMNDHLDDILGIDAQGVSEIKAILSDDDTATGLITELAKKATQAALQAEIDRSTGKDNSHDMSIQNLQDNKADKSNMAAGTYRSVTVNNQGIVTAGTNPTTIAGYKISDAKIENGTIILGQNSITPLTQHQDISGKANKATTLAGYGITDAKIQNGTITLGENSITPLTSHQDVSGKANSADVYTKTEIDDIINAIKGRLTVLESYWRLNTTTNRLETSYVIEPEGYR